MPLPAAVLAAALDAVFNVTVTCKTSGCPVEGVAFQATVSPNYLLTNRVGKPDFGDLGVLRVVCGRCGNYNTTGVTLA